MTQSAPVISDAELAAQVKERGRELGFSLVGIAPAARPDTLDLFREWTNEGHHGSMNYLVTRDRAYEHPEGVMPGVRSVIVTAMNYGPGREAESGTGRIAAYAQGTADYHDVLRKKLKELAKVLHQARPDSHSRVTIDTAPLLERDVARRAGLGWFGKNTMLINKHQGSYFFLGAILTDCSLPPDAAHETSHCGTCTRCLEACPTDAFVGPHVLDARKCISYLTIEMRGEPIPVDLRPGVGEWMFGCDVCQQVCPWNRKATPTAVPEFQPASVTARSAVEFLMLDEETFRADFRKSPLSRPGYENMQRNAAIVLGNLKDANAVAPLIKAQQSLSPIVRGAVAWALGQIGTPEALAALTVQLETDTDLTVQQECRSALEQTRNSRGLPSRGDPSQGI